MLSLAVGARSAGGIASGGQPPPGRLLCYELPGLGTAQVAAIVRFRSEHGPIKDADQLATILSGYPLADTLRERADFPPSDDTAPEAPGA